MKKELWSTHPIETPQANAPTKNAKASSNRKKIPPRGVPSQLSNRAWQHGVKVLPPPAKKPAGVGRPPVELRALIQVSVVRSGWGWARLPPDYPHYKTVYGSFWPWRYDGTWGKVHPRLVKKRPRKAGRNPGPSAGSLDWQSGKPTQVGRERGFDRGKLVRAAYRPGRKRFLLVDSQGWLLRMQVGVASVRNAAQSEKAGAMLLLRHLKEVPCLANLCRRLKRVWVDGGYQGPDWPNSVAALWGWGWQVNKGSDDQQGFRVRPRRWVVEGPFGW